MPKHIHPAVPTLASELKKARLAKGWSQGELGQRVGLPQSHVSKIEQGNVDLQLSSLLELARALDLELSLIPRRVLSAVKAVTRSATLDHSPVADLLGSYLRLASDFETARSDLPAAADFAKAVREARLLSFEPDEITRIKKALNPVRAVRAKDDARPDDWAKAFARASRALREIRDAKTHLVGRDVQRPAYSLSDDDD